MDVTSIYILEAYQGLGLGRKLLMHLFEKFQSLHINSALAWVLAENNARFFYEKLGAKLIEDNRSISIGKDSFPLIAYGWEDINIVL